MSSAVVSTSRLKHSETQSGGCGVCTMKAENTATGLPAESTGSVVWSGSVTGSVIGRVNQSLVVTVGLIGEFWRCGASDGCRAAFRLQSAPTLLITLPPTLAGVFRPGLGKYCSRSTGGSRTQ